MAEILKDRVRFASMWVVGGYGASQALRLGGNLILTRFLVPEFFGLMAIAQVFINGLFFFSDIGLGPGVIRSKRSNDQVFLNTAWTLQIFRGVILWLITFAIAGPVATFYKSPILSQMLPIIGLMFVATSFSSTSIYTLNKEIKLGKITAMELVSQLCGLVCMIFLAYRYRNVWSLVAGSLVSAIIKMVWSHFLECEIRNRFTLETASVKELFSFGKWIFFSTAMMFLATQADRLLLGKLCPLALFGVYNIAVIFAELPKQILGKLSNKVIFPLMTHYVDFPRPDFRQKILQKRKQILIPLILLISIFSGFGDFIILILYDERYHHAGWMLPLLAIGMWPFVLSASVDRCFYAIGKPKIPAYGNLCKFIYMVAAVPTMFHLFGVMGGVLTVAINDLPAYVVNQAGLKREGLSCFQQDVFYTFILILLISIILCGRFAFGVGFPGGALLGDI